MAIRINVVLQGRNQDLSKSGGHKCEHTKASAIKGSHGSLDLRENCEHVDRSIGRFLHFEHFIGKDGDCKPFME